MNSDRISESYKLRDERIGSIPTIPGDYKRGVTIVSTGSDIDINPWIRALSTVRTPLWRFPSPKSIVLSSKPVSVKTSKGETLFFAENENLGIYATGDSIDEAISAFCEQLVHFYKHYKRLSWGRVTGEAHRLKELYENLFSENRI